MTTPHITQAQAALTSMYESLPANSAVKLYLTTLKNVPFFACAGDMLPLTGHTGLFTGLLDANSIASSTNTHDLAETGQSAANAYTESGIYLFIDKETGDPYIGYATDFQTRLNNYYREYSKLTRKLNTC